MNLKIADFFIGTLSGALMASCVYLVVPPSINILIGMIIGGLIGMCLMMVLMILLMPFFGAFEVMIPLHINGMLIGMSAGMLSTLPSLSFNDIILGGGTMGFFVSLIIYLSNKRLTQS